MTITEIRQLTGLSMTAFAKLYGIPYRSLQNWEAGIREPPPYLLTLLERVVKADFPQD